MSHPECICDDLEWDEYCSEECDGPYEEWKKMIEEEKARLREEDKRRKEGKNKP